MGQDWLIINLDARETSSSRGKLGEFFPCGGGRFLIPKLMPVPSKPLDGVLGFDRTQLKPRGQPTPGQKPSLVNLPPELVRSIFEQLDDVLGAICLGLTCKELLIIGEKRIQTLLRPKTAPWAEDRIICIGDYCRNNDMPPGMLTQDEMESLNMMEMDPLEEELANLYDYASSYFTEVGTSSTSMLWEDIDSDFTEKLRLFDFCNLHRLLKPDVGQKGRGSIVPWVLLNLTKKEYLLPHAVIKHGKAGFGCFLLSRICWSSDPSVSMPYTGGIHRGVWAGDRFAFRTIDSVEGGLEGWKDVSDEMYAEMAAIWESEFGTDWQQPQLRRSR